MSGFKLKSWKHDSKTLVQRHARDTLDRIEERTCAAFPPQLFEIPACDANGEIRLRNALAVTLGQ